MNWISLIDRKPVQDQKVLISAGKIVTAAEVDINSSADIWWDQCEVCGYDRDWTFEVKDITHWMPLPEPYK